MSDNQYPHLKISDFLETDVVHLNIYRYDLLQYINWFFLKICWTKSQQIINTCNQYLKNIYQQ